MKIVIVAHEILFREGLVYLLQSQPDFQVLDEAGTGIEAIEKARRLIPDVILSAANLPDILFFNAVKAFLTISPQVRIFLFVDNESPEFFLEAIRNGVQGLFHKDIDFNSLLESLRSSDRDEMIFSQKVFQQILADFRKSGTNLEKHTDLNSLTPRERDVFRLICMNATNREIGAQLFVSVNTVRNHVHNILNKLKLKNRSEVREKYSFLFQPLTALPLGSLSDEN